MPTSDPPKCLTPKRGRPPKYDTDVERRAARKKQLTSARLKWKSQPGNGKKCNQWEKGRALRMSGRVLVVPRNDLPRCPACSALITMSVQMNYLLLLAGSRHHTHRVFSCSNNHRFTHISERSFRALCAAVEKGKANADTK